MKKMSEHASFGNIITAVYKEQELIDFKGNPLIEALPPILSPEEAYEKLCYYPPYDKYEVNLAPHLRYYAIPRISRFFQPVMQHLDLEQRFSRLLRHGYVSRNPKLPDYNKALMGLRDIRYTASSMSLIGFSGIGKTTAIERILSLYPQVIMHEYPLNLMQVVWLKLNCPNDGSLKSFCMDFFLKIDILLGTKYHDKFGNSRNSISSMLTQMGQVARLHCIGAIIIDEIQHLLATKDNNSEKMMNFFVTLINEVGVPIILIGTMKAKVVLQQDFRQARRGSGQGNMVWQQMDKNDDWDFLVESLWKYQWIQNYTDLTEELNQTLYEESQGILDIAIKLFGLAQGRAIETRQEIITPAFIKQVAKEDLSLVQPMLKALKNGRMSELEKYADIIPMDIEEYLRLRESKIDLRATIQKKKELQAQKRQQKQVTNLETLISSLIALGINVEIAQKAATRVLNEMVDNDLPSLMKKAISFCEQSNIPKDKQVKKKLGTLLEIVKNAKKNKQSNYELLKESGYIKSPLDDFVL